MARGRKTGGRQKGTPNKASAQTRRTVLEFARNLMADPAYWDYLKHRIMVGQVAPQIELYFLQLDGGKPKETVDLQHSGALRVKWES